MHTVTSPFIVDLTPLLLQSNFYSQMESHIYDYIHLILRWVHFTVGIAWIGASFYFNWLENNLNRLESENRDELAGHLWAVHGGGFYYLEKYKVAPKKIPKHLHWFKWEAYFTWISGISLLILLYYLHPQSYLIDPQVSELSPQKAVLISISVLLLGWMIYDLLCKSPLQKKPQLLSLVGFLMISGLSFFLTHTFSGRAAYLHVGAVIGTIMVANVFFVIIPSQKAMVNAAIKGETPDEALGKKALLRSKHNNYLTLPVLFVMLSQHFPATYSHTYHWIILTALILLSVLVRHYFNIRQKKQNAYLIWPLVLVGAIALAYLTKPHVESLSTQREVQFETVKAIIQNRCIQCHSTHATDDVFKIAPNGIVFDTDSDLLQHAARIKFRTFDTKTMPLANKTQITDEERAILGAWVNQLQLKD